ncbi:hypothetical protein BS50DRAFT_587562 [Corynespora cassiicola Philippines]|uniref:Mif2/CENP-C cupin domain-containing protein n=1 Tax=Corynespora cassiicola Philippines TaxID=1448308 RepID=A0A2T2NSG7_CORCC|nr:hypothetical protein BS50DRAFT_587562 [Corynespora cassiicola Philippines]
MPPNRKRENRENQFYDVGVQGRKTGITLEDRGLRDEYGLEPISGIFSSPEKSPPKRATGGRQTGGTVTESESMDIQENDKANVIATSGSVPDLATSAQLLRNNRTHFPPPRSRSPIKTALGSSPRRHSSMVPRLPSSDVPSSPAPAASTTAVSRRLEFEQEEDTSLQETPALSGSGQRRGKRSIYSVEPSPSRAHSVAYDESMVQEEIAVNDESGLDTELPEQTLAEIGNDSIAGADAAEPFLGAEESEVVSEPPEPPEPPKQPAKRGRKRKSDAVEAPAEVSEVASEPPESPRQPAKRGRKRKSDAVEAPAEDEPTAGRPRKRGAAAAQASLPQKKGKKAADDATTTQQRRSKRVSDVASEEPSNVEESAVDVSEQIEEPPAKPKSRGRPPKAKSKPEDTAPAKEKAAPVKEKAALAKQKVAPVKEKPEVPAFKKPNPATKKPKAKADAEAGEKDPKTSEAEPGRLVDAYGKPLSKAELDKMSTTSAGSRYGRGRQLSVYRELDPDNVARIGRTGRHRVAPIDFWKNDKINYDHQGGMQSIVRNENQEPVPVKKGSRGKGRRRTLTVVEEEQELDPWEEEDGVFTGEYREFDPINEVVTDAIIEDKVAWAVKGINPVDVPDASFRFTKLASAGQQEAFFAWGFIELKPDQMKRTKNSRRMHMVFHVHAGAVEVKMHDNEFSVHKGGVFQVPRGEFQSFTCLFSSPSFIATISASSMDILHSWHAFSFGLKRRYVIISTHPVLVCTQQQRL